MKNALSFFAALLLLAACNSSNNNSGETQLNNSSTGNARADSWTNEDQISFMDDCINEAGRNLSRDSAQKYCACVLTKAQSVYPNFRTADEKMTIEQVNQWASECLQQPSN